MYRRPKIFSTVWLLATVLAASAAAEEPTRSYGHVRTLQGSATLLRGDTGEREELMRNYPLQAADRIESEAESAVELVLADYNIIRIGEHSAVDFPELANSADTEDQRSVLRLERGELQIVVTEMAVGEELPTLLTPLATIYLHEPGTYLIEVDEVGRARLVTRNGYAVLSTSAGSTVVAAGEEVVDAGVQGIAPTAEPASPPTALEDWGEALTLAAADLPVEEVDPELGYAASALESHGEWVEAEGASAWRPYASAGWRPFTAGTWVSTHAGLTWVGFESWSWITGHYGRWRLDPYWGWIWFPGRAYSPAHVYWYWGPNWVGWVPSGYYGRSAWSGHFYGYAGGAWSYYRDWTFCPTSWIGRRRGHEHHYSGRAMPGVSGRPAVPRGVVSSETSGLTRVEWRDGPGAARELIGRGDGRARRRDLTGFVAGREELPRAAISRRPVIPEAGDRAPSRGFAAPRGETTVRSETSQTPVRRLIDRLRRERDPERRTLERERRASGLETQAAGESSRDARRRGDTERRQRAAAAERRRDSSARSESSKRSDPSSSASSRRGGQGRSKATETTKRRDSGGERKNAQRSRPKRKRPDG